MNENNTSTPRSRFRALRVLAIGLAAALIAIPTVGFAQGFDMNSLAGNVAGLISPEEKQALQELPQNQQAAVMMSYVLMGDMSPGNQAAFRPIIASGMKGAAGASALDNALREWSRRGDDDGKRGAIAMEMMGLAIAGRNSDEIVADFAMKVLAGIMSGETWCQGGTIGSLLGAAIQKSAMQQ